MMSLAACVTGFFLDRLFGDPVWLYDPFVWDSVCGTEGGAEYPSVDLLFLRVVLVLSDLCGKISE